MLNKNFCILYVDDERQNLVSFKAAFRREYRILIAQSAKEGLELMRSQDIHLVITDQRMPEMTGVQFLEQIIPEFPDPVRIVLTGFSDVEAIINAINKGQVFRYITKPWDENELRMTFENARQLYELQQKNKTLLLDLKSKVEEQEKTLRLFMKYVPESVVEKALNSNEESIFEGQQQFVTVLFCDIRGFTPMSENLPPKEVVSFLNDYYALMTRIIKHYQGSVMQFVGDEVFATFGAPLALPDACQKAVFCALEMIKQLKEFNQQRKERLGLKDEILVGIGINAGEVVVGNLGSEDKISYSVTGDTVNTGKRIETLTKEYPNSILASETVYEKVKDWVHVKPWKPMPVKGKKEPVMVYEIISRKNT